MNAAQGSIQVVSEPLINYLSRLSMTKPVRKVMLASAFMRRDGIKQLIDVIGGINSVSNADVRRIIFREITQAAYKYLATLNFEVRTHDLLHAKLYIIEFNNNEYLGIVGSSNLSTHGLERNREVNIVVMGSLSDPFYRSLYNDLYNVFDELWNESREPSPEDIKLVILRRSTASKLFISQLNERLRKLLGIGELSIGEYRRETIGVIHNKLRKLKDEAENKGLVEEELVRELVARMYGGPNELSKRLAKACGDYPSDFVLDVPCVMVYAAHEVCKGGCRFNSGIDFYEAVLDKAKDLIDHGEVKLKPNVEDFINKEYAHIHEKCENKNSKENEKECYREQFVERKIGAAILPLILALPGNCRVTFEIKGNRRERRIACS